MIGRNCLRIAAIVLTMAALIWVVGESLRTPHQSGGPPGQASPLVAESAAPGPVLATETVGDPQRPARDLSTYYARRAYPGAPPVIPHTLEQAESCNTCHAAGGYVARFEAWTPVTPHAEFTNCRQCHVPADSAFSATVGPPIKRPAIPGGPPPIPHGLQLRENCAACHVGPAVPAPIRCTHPERESCTQCHVAKGMP